MPSRKPILRSLRLLSLASLLTIAAFSVINIYTPSLSKDGNNQASQQYTSETPLVKAPDLTLSLDSNLKPFENQPAKGLNYDGLKNGGKDGTDTCIGSFAVEIETKNGKEVYCTHGPDPVPKDPESAPITAPNSTGDKSTMQVASGTGTLCYGDGSTGRRVQALYVTTAANDKFTTVEPQIKQWAGYADTKVNESAARTGGARHIKWVTDSNCDAVVEKVIVDDAAISNIGATVSALKSQGYDRNDRKYLMWTEGTQYCGMALMHIDDTADPTQNADNTTAGYARVDRQCWGMSDSTELHELIHTLGGVQPSAPNATPAGHCTDENDLMCYADTSGMPMRQVCTKPGDSGLLDCNNDDYFNTNPPAGSYLDTHWNTAGSYFLFESNPADTVAPTTPANLQPSNLKYNSVTMSWDKATDNVSLVAYKLFRNDVLIGTKYDTDAYSTGRIFHTDATVSPLTTYSYHVVAVDDNGNESAPSPKVTVTTPASDTTPPTVPPNFRLVSLNPTSYTVAWDPSNDTESGLKYYRIQGTFVHPSISPTFTMCCGNVQPNTSYTVSVTAIDNAGNESQPATITFTTPTIDEPPTTPSNLKIKSSTGSSISLEWGPSTDLGGISWYTIYRKSQSETSFNAIGSVNSTQTNYSDTTVTYGKTYSYQIIAYDTYQKPSQPSNTLTTLFPVIPESEPTSQSTYVYRFWSDTYKHHFYTTSYTEANQVVTGFSPLVWKYESVGFSVPKDCTGFQPVYRFWSDAYRAHFYTISVQEKNSLIATNPNWKYETEAFCASTSSNSSTPTGVYRFWSDVYKGHFYTTSVAEKDNLIATNPNWRYEGIAFYVR